MREHRMVRGRRAVLAAVSGGLDSVVMAHLLQAAGVPFAIAHCNFGLRGKESDGDARFVRSLAARLHVPFHGIRFSTTSFAKDNGLGIQAAARMLRYDWFRHVIKEHGYQSVATAHHADDVAETILLNMLRGAALSGYHGIRPYHNKIIRPLLFASRKEIEEYAETVGFSWRDDSSNETDHYTRNRIRHHIMPLLREINPSVEKTLLRNAAIMEGYEAIVREYTSELFEERITRKGKNIIIDIRNWMDEPKGTVMLYEWLRDLRFTGDACRNLSRGILAGSTGKTYFGGNYVAALERNQVVISPVSGPVVLPEITLKPDGKVVETPFFKLQAETVELKAGFKMDRLPDFTNRQVAWLDAAKFTGSLKLAPWRKGDRFHPLGLKGTKLVSDFMTDLQFTSEQKEKLYLLKVGSDIAWVTGYRIDDRFKLDSRTRTALKVTLYTL